MSDTMHYDPNPVIDYAESIGCPAVGIAGGKGNGKTYGIILRYLKRFIDDHKPLRYLRRYKESISRKALMSLCNPQKQNLINLTGGKYNDFQYFANRFYLIRREEGKIVDKELQPFMICSALNSVESSTGADEGECSAIFYDEFLSREKELPDEFYDLMIFHNNCVRNRTENYCPLILVGNTVTRGSSLARNFGVNLYKMKKGSITVVKNSKEQPTMVFEYCDEVEVMQAAADTYYKRFESDRLNMIYHGDWTTSNYPYMPLQQRRADATSITIKIVCRESDSALIYTFCRTAQGRKYGSVERDTGEREKHTAQLINITRAFKDRNVFNYLPQQGIFKQFMKLVFTKNTYFADCETGEMFRDFLKNFKGCEAIANVYI